MILKELSEDVVKVKKNMRKWKYSKEIGKKQKKKKKRRRRKQAKDIVNLTRTQPQILELESTTDMKSSLEESKADLSMQKKGSKNLKIGWWT